MIGAVLAILLTLAAGAPVALRRRWTSPGLTYLLGSGIVFLALELLAFAGVSWTPVTVVAATAVLAVAAGALLQKRTRGPLGNAKIEVTALDALTAAFLVVYALYATGAAPWHWDYSAIWGVKARVFFEHGGIDWRFLTSPFNAFTHTDYPQLVPFHLALPSVLSGTWDDRWLGLVFAAFVAATALAVREITALDLSRWTSSATAFALTALAASHYIGLAEVMVIALAVPGVLLVRRAALGDDACWTPGALLLGFAASAKNEGISLILSIGLVLLLRRQWKSLLRLWPALFVIAPWLIAANMQRLALDLTSGSPLARAEQHLPRLAYLLQLLVAMVEKPWCWVVVLFALPFAMRRERFLLGVTIFQFLFFLAALIITPNELTWHVQTAWDRLSRQLLVLAVAATLLALGKILDLRTEASTPAPDPA